LTALDQARLHFHAPESGARALDARVSISLPMTRRGAAGMLLSALGIGLVPARVLAAADRLGPPRPFSWDSLVARARSLAGKTFVVRPASPSAVSDYDEMVRLTYGEAEAVAGCVRLFPASKAIAPQAVAIHVVEGGQARAITDTAGLFIGGRDAEPAGFRVMHPDGRTDWLAFLGASYFRASGSRDQYGLSARGIAIDTGLAGTEEFPGFTEFWIEQRGAARLRIHALLDGPSLTGAYAFDCFEHKRGAVQDVDAALFFRRDIEQLGIAPASSMFWYDQSGQRGDWRPEIHDSDGLAIFAGDGERVWRPLRNPSRQTLSTFRADHPRGFGLIQRDQSFDHYQDDGVFYDRRPSLWVEPRGDWGKGAVRLFEMPSRSETMDNVAMFWCGDEPARAGGSRRLSYRLVWTSNDPSGDAAARCVDVFEGPAGIPGAPPIEGARKFVFDFAGPALEGLDRSSGVEAVASLPADAIIAASAYPVVGVPARWRAMLDVQTGGLDQSEFRVFLKRGDAALSETVIKSVKP
jgi:glucans biosynthesis protein